VASQSNYRPQSPTAPRLAHFASQSSLNLPGPPSSPPPPFSSVSSDLHQISQYRRLDDPLELPTASSPVETNPRHFNSPNWVSQKVRPPPPESDHPLLRAISQEDVSRPETPASPQPLDLSGSPGSASSSASPRRTASIVSTDTSSGSSDSRSRTENNLFGFRWGLQSKKTPKVRVKNPLPVSLTFAFSSPGSSILLWKRNGSSLLRINLTARQSRAIPLANMASSSEAGSGVNIKLVAEGDEWVAAVVYNKLVCLSSVSPYIILIGCRSSYLSFPTSLGSHILWSLFQPT
jgi:hypothetical protein